MRKTVMVVDDSVFIYGEMKHMLENSDYEITAYAKSGEEALTLYEKTNPDVVTMDIILPGIDGLDTAKLILERWPDAKIVFVSSLAYDETMEQAKDLGAQEFIFKPIEEEQMLSVLDRITD